MISSIVEKLRSLFHNSGSKMNSEDKRLIQLSSDDNNKNTTPVKHEYVWKCIPGSPFPKHKLHDSTQQSKTPDKLH